jgi:alpha 1,2-mannosyltransferase
LIRNGIETYDILDYTDEVILIKSNVGARPFQLKPMALMYTDLEEVLLIDADSTPLRDPTFLFDDARYLAAGTVFWPDYWVTANENPIWDVLGIAPSRQLEQESGQLLVNKAKA